MYSYSILYIVDYILKSSVKLVPLFNVHQSTTEVMDNNGSLSSHRSKRPGSNSDCGNPAEDPCKEIGHTYSTGL